MKRELLSTGLYLAGSLKNPTCHRWTFLMEFTTAKTTAETWEQYVQRLVDANYLTPEDQEKWRSGRARKWTRKVQVTRFDVVLRIRMIEKNNRQIEQVYACLLYTSDAADE